MRKRYSRSEWETLIAKQQQSGQSIEVFCRRNSLAISTFQKRKKRIIEEEVGVA